MTRQYTRRTSAKPRDRPAKDRDRRQASRDAPWRADPYENTYFGMTGRMHTTLKTTATKSMQMRFIPSTAIGTALPQSVPYGFAQIVLTLQDTTFMLGPAAEFWDRAIVRRIKFKYAPTGTETIFAAILAQQQNQLYLSPPYANSPLLITYDPTANVLDANQALLGMDRLLQQGQITTNFITESVRAQRQSQHYIGETTKPFKGRIVSPRTMLVSPTGPQGFTSRNEIDLGNQYKITYVNGALVAPRQYEHVATYGTLNFLIPRVLSLPEQEVPVSFQINVTITYELELFGQT